MFRASSDHLQEDTVIHVQHMVLSLSMRVPGGLSVHSSHSSCVPTGQWRTQEFFSGGVQQIQLRTEDRENGDLGAVAT